MQVQQILINLFCPQIFVYKFFKKYSKRKTSLILFLFEDDLNFVLQFWFGWLDLLKQRLREGVNKIINYLAGIFHGALNPKIVYSMAFRLLRICSEEEAFENRLVELKTEFLIPRNYSSKIIDSQFKRVKHLPGDNYKERRKLSENKSYCTYSFQKSMMFSRSILKQ